MHIICQFTIYEIMHYNFRPTCPDCDHRLWGWYSNHCPHIQSSTSQTSCDHSKRVGKGSRSSPGLPWRVSQLFTWLNIKEMIYRTKMFTSFLLLIKKEEFYEKWILKKKSFLQVNQLKYNYTKWQCVCSVAVQVFFVRKPVLHLVLNLTMQNIRK